MLNSGKIVIFTMPSSDLLSRFIVEMSQSSIGGFNGGVCEELGGGESLLQSFLTKLPRVIKFPDVIDHGVMIF
jgi:hypothetical protein